MVGRGHAKPAASPTGPIAAVHERILHKLGEWQGGTHRIGCEGLSRLNDGVFSLASIRLPCLLARLIQNELSLQTG